VDFKKDQLHIRFDPGTLKPEQLAEVVRKTGFQPVFVPGKAAKDGGK
jgi:hypothetical protein